MKNLSLLILALILVSCNKEKLESDSRDCREVEYNANFDVQLSEEVCFPDGKSLTLTSVEHQFCPCGAVCVWEGDLYITLTTITDQEAEKVKTIYPSRIEIDRSVFDNHEITSLSYTYDEAQEVPACAEDFEADKIILTLSISPI